MRVLVVGSGAREHALASAIAVRAQVIVAPGNAGTARFAKNAPVKADDIAGIVDLAAKEAVDLVVVGPEAPLVAGLVDALDACGILAYGPTRAAAALEGSKVFMKQFLARHAIPTAAFEVFDDPDRAARHVRALPSPPVVKTDGLAAGKGVTVASSTEEALEAIDRMMKQREFGDAGARIVVEERLPGEEASFHFVCDGKNHVALVPAQDHKRVGDGDQGPNTGGMGAYAPAPIVTPAVREKVIARVVEPTLRGMAAEGAPFKGTLFVGLMIENDEPRVLEFNVRFGDPETSVLVPMYAGDWLSLLEASARGDVSQLTAPVHAGAALCVVMASQGYPGKPRTGDVIRGLDREPAGGAYVHHAGTSSRGADVVTAGGRVLTVGARGVTLADAAERAYAEVARIGWEGEHHRKDIGYRALARST